LNSQPPLVFQSHTCGRISAAIVADYIFKHGKAAPFQIAEYIKIVESRQRVTIQVVEAFHTPTRVRGYIAPYSGEALIVTCAEDNDCWRRYTVAKELIHLSLVDYDTATTDVVNLLESLASIDFAVAFDDKAVYCERIAEVLALDLLVPWEVQPDLLALAAHKSQNDIAQHFRIPQYFIARRLSPNHRKMLATIGRI
jgi:Zn-dependent peptidase ImmA (M78 family)